MVNITLHAQSLPPMFASAGIANYTSMALNKNGVPYVAYQDGAISNKATVRKDSGGIWVTVGPHGSGISTYEAYGTGIVVDSNSNPYIIFADAGKGYKATVMHYNGSAWSLVGTEGFTHSRDYYPSLTLDSLGTPYMAYTDSSQGYKITAMKYTGSAWSIVGSAGFSSANSGSPTIKFGKYNTPYVVFNDGGAGYKTTVMKYASGTWSNVGSAGFSAGEAWYTSMAIDRYGTPYVAFSDLSNRSRVTVMKYNGSSWANVGSTGVSYYLANWVDIAIDTFDTPYVLYGDYNANVKKFDGTNWVQVGVVDISGFIASWNRIGITKKGTPIIAYQDNNARYGPSDNTYKDNYCVVKKYNGTKWTAMSDTSGGCPAIALFKKRSLVQAPDTNMASQSYTGAYPVSDYERNSNASIMSLYPNPNKGMVNIDVSIGNSSHGFSIEIFNMTGNIVYQSIHPGLSGYITQTVNLSHLSAGEYLVKLTTGDTNKTKILYIQK